MIINTQKLKKFQDVENVWYLDDYLPHSHGGPADEFDKMIMDIKSHGKEPWQLKKQKKAVEYFVNEIIAAIKKGHDECVICRIPRSKTNVPENYIYEIAKKVCMACDFIDGTDILTRYKSINTAHITNIHSEADHYNSIKIVDLEKVKGREILLLDDVVTYGCSMSACIDLLSEARAKSICGLAMGKTIR